MKWSELKDIQDQAIKDVIYSDSDIIISAGTASGKTEAAFLPVLTSIAEDQDSSISVLYIGPLKALINDQFSRIELLCHDMDIKVVKWHGEANNSEKRKLIKNPKGSVALITPESIEALFINKPNEANKMFKHLKFIIIDELHYFLNGPRGLHLFSLLQRIDKITGYHVRRIGLSATIGNFILAKKWLNFENSETVKVIESKSGKNELRLKIFGYEDEDVSEDVEQEGVVSYLDLISDRIFKNDRGTNNLVFAGSRRRVEAICDRLVNRSTFENVPNEFFPHHGSLSKENREALEFRLKDGQKPTTAIATTTLELGIDIGSVKSIDVIGAPKSLSSLKQRLGRSGRREGEPSILKVHVRESSKIDSHNLINNLRFETVRAISSILLLIDGYVESINYNNSLFSVIFHQILSLLYANNGFRPDQLYNFFSQNDSLLYINKNEYIVLLKYMKERQFIEQIPDGTLLLGELGESLVHNKDFYALFNTPNEWQVIADGKDIGKIPLTNNIKVDMTLLFSGKRWRIFKIDYDKNILFLEKSNTGSIPSFESSGYETISDELSLKMKSVYQSKDIYNWIDDNCLIYLNGARKYYEDYDIEHNILLGNGYDTLFFTWYGTDFNEILSFILSSYGLKDIFVHDIGISISNKEVSFVKQIINKINTEERINIEEIFKYVDVPFSYKYDEYIAKGLIKNRWIETKKDIINSVLLYLKNTFS